MDEFEYDDSSEDGDVTYTFERLDETGPARWLVSTIHRRDFPRYFRALTAKFPARVVDVDPRPWNHPAKLAEATALRDRLYALRLERGWKPRRRSGG